MSMQSGDVAIWHLDARGKIGAKLPTHQHSFDAVSAGVMFEPMERTTSGVE